MKIDLKFPFNYFFFKELCDLSAAAPQDFSCNLSEIRCSEEVKNI